MKRPVAWLLALLLADWSLPFGFLNRLFHARGWFPTRMTGWFVEALASPGSPAAILVVSASAPRFWVMGVLLFFSLGLAVAALRRRSLPWKGLWLPAAQLLLFVLAEGLLPWLAERGTLQGRVVDLLFPMVPRGHGRAYGWLHLPALAAFFFFIRTSAGGHPSAVGVK